LRKSTTSCVSSRRVASSQSTPKVRGWRKRCLSLSLWRRVVRLGDFRFQLRRSEAVLPAVWKDGMEADKDRYRTASVGMGDVQKGHRRHRATQPSNRRQLHTMLLERGPHNSGRHADMSGVQSVHFVDVSDRHDELRTIMLMTFSSSNS